jgi:hypothetical protein
MNHKSNRRNIFAEKVIAETILVTILRNWTIPIQNVSIITEKARRTVRKHLNLQEYKILNISVV